MTDPSSSCSPDRQLFLQSSSCLPSASPYRQVRSARLPHLDCRDTLSTRRVVFFIDFTTLQAFRWILSPVVRSVRRRGEVGRCHRFLWHRSGQSRSRRYPGAGHEGVRSREDGRAEAGQEYGAMEGLVGRSRFRWSQADSSGLVCCCNSAETFCFYPCAEKRDCCRDRGLSALPEQKSRTPNVSAKTVQLASHRAADVKEGKCDGSCQRRIACTQNSC